MQLEPARAAVVLTVTGSAAAPSPVVRLWALVRHPVEVGAVGGACQVVKFSCMIFAVSCRCAVSRDWLALVPLWILLDRLWVSW